MENQNLRANLFETIVTPVLVTPPVIFELLRVNCGDLRIQAPTAVLTLTRFMPGQIIDERNVII